MVITVPDTVTCPSRTCRIRDPSEAGVEAMVIIRGRLRGRNLVLIDQDDDARAGWEAKETEREQDKLSLRGGATGQD